MRLEQLLLDGPDGDCRLRFGPGLTVFSGLNADERAELIATLASSISGHLPSASLTYFDQDGRKVYTDRGGASYADTGDLAPPLADLVGRDPDVVQRMLTVSVDSLGLEPARSSTELQDDLAAARDHATRLDLELTASRERSTQVDIWRSELVDLDRRIERADGDRARWAWVQRGRRLEDLRAQLEGLDQGSPGGHDRRVLASVGALRELGEAWAEAAQAAAEARRHGGSAAGISREDVARVAATPDDVPAAFHGRIRAWARASRRLADAEAARDAIGTDADPQAEADTGATDPLVDHFAMLDQDRLWSLHSVLDAASAEAPDPTGDDPAEPTPPTSLPYRLELDLDDRRMIETARANLADQRALAARRQRMAALCGRVLQHAPRGAGAVVSPLAAAPLVLLAAVVGWAMILRPRRDVRLAEIVEFDVRTQLTAGMRIRHIQDDSGRPDHRFAPDVAAVRVGWYELVGDHEPEALTARADAVLRRATLANPEVVAARRCQADAEVSGLRAELAAARTDLFRGLERYGLPEEAAGNLSPDEIGPLVAQRIHAGQVARRLLATFDLEEAEQAAADRLDALLSSLGYPDGDLDTRLDAAITAIDEARRHVPDDPDHDLLCRLDAEIRDLEQQVAEGERPNWTGPHPETEPTNPDMLEARRSEISELVAAARRPDVPGLERELTLATERIAEIEREIERTADAPHDARTRLLERIARTTPVDGRDVLFPVVVDDALSAVSETERFSVLDDLVNLSRRVQVVVLTDDPIIDRWARTRVGDHPVTLYEVAAAAAVS